MTVPWLCHLLHMSPLPLPTEPWPLLLSWGVEYGSSERVCQAQGARIGHQPAPWPVWHPFCSWLKASTVTDELLKVDPEVTHKDLPCNRLGPWSWKRGVLPKADSHLPQSQSHVCPDRAEWPHRETGNSPPGLSPNSSSRPRLGKISRCCSSVPFSG